MTVSSLPTAQLVIYSILALPTIYLLFRHGKKGLLGWIYLLILCILRITGSSLLLIAINHGTSSSTASLISNIGLSPLLLATSGILHESRHYLKSIPSSPTPPTEWIAVLLIHFLVATGIGMAASGSSALSSPNPSSSSLLILKIGICTLELVWVLIVLGTFFTLLSIQTRNIRNRESASPAHRNGHLLLYGIIFSLPFSGIRILYSLISTLTGEASLNPITGELGVRIGLSLVPEIVAVLVLITAGFVTRNAKRMISERATNGEEMLMMERK